MSAAAITAADLGVPSETTCLIAADHVQRIAATLDTAAPVDGDPLPLLWHWAFFTPTTPTAALGPDGHPRLDPDGPTAALPSRMWAGGRVHLSDPLTVGQPAIRHSSVTRTRETTGRSGPLLLVTMEHRYEQAGVDRIHEEQDLVYRAGGATLDLPAGNHCPDAPPDGWSTTATIHPPMLFRFSALTFNSHRIHYDERYARDHEGYPALVVHGPLTALLLAESTRAGTGRELRSFEFRASAPLFAGVPFTIVGSTSGASADARAVRNDGLDAMTASMQLG